MNKVIYTILFTLISVITFAQTSIIHGKLIDRQTGKGVSGATIFYQQQYIISDEDGGFELHNISNTPPKSLLPISAMRPMKN